MTMLPPVTVHVHVVPTGSTSMQRTISRELELHDYIDCHITVVVDSATICILAWVDEFTMDKCSTAIEYHWTEEKPEARQYTQKVEWWTSKYVHQLELHCICYFWYLSSIARFPQNFNFR